MHNRIKSPTGDVVVVPTREPGSHSRAFPNARGYSSNSSRSSGSTTATALHDEGDDGDIVIAVMGASGAGKTTFINLASGSCLRVGYGLASETKQVKTASFQYGGRNIVLVDTPGFDDTEVSDTDTLHTIALWLDATYRSNKLLSGVIYLHRITDNRVGGISYKNIRLFHKLCGRDAMHNVVLCTTMWELVTEDLGIAREQQLSSDFWKSMIDEGARVARHDGTLESARKNISSLSNLQPIALTIQESLAEGKTLLETDAGMEINKELLALQAKHERDLEETKHHMEEAIRENDVRAQRMILAEQVRLEERLAKERQEQERLAASRTEEIEALKRALRDASRPKKRNFLQDILPGVLLGVARLLL